MKAATAGRRASLGWHKALYRKLPLDIGGDNAAAKFGDRSLLVDNAPVAFRKHFAQRRDLKRRFVAFGLRFGFCV